MTRISVAMATYNGERFIGEQLSSIGRQSRLPDELVICDDGSTDATVEIAERFAAGAPFDVVVRRNDRQLGHHENFFVAIGQCTGDLIATCDQDDVWREDKLALCEAPFLAKARVSVVAHSARAVDEHLRALGWSNQSFRVRRREVLSAGTVTPGACYAGFVLTFRSSYVRRLDIAARPVEDGNRLGHDHWITLVCGALGDVELLPQDLVLWRRHGTNWSNATPDSPLRRLAHATQTTSPEAGYRFVAQRMRARCDYLTSLSRAAQAMPPPAEEGLERAIERHRRLARALDRRAAVYHLQRRRGRVALIARHAVTGDYSARSGGGLGVPALARDVTLGFRL